MTDKMLRFIGSSKKGSAAFIYIVNRYIFTVIFCYLHSLRLNSIGCAVLCFPCLVRKQRAGDKFASICSQFVAINFGAAYPSQSRHSFIPRSVCVCLRVCYVIQCLIRALLPIPHPHASSHPALDHRLGEKLNELVHCG